MLAGTDGFRKGLTLWLILAGPLLGISPLPLFAEEPVSPEERWLETDIGEINEGELEFLARPPDRPVHHLTNRLTITERSLNDGWVGLVQCHANLDAVPDAEIVYRYRAMRDLEVRSFANIGQARVEGQSVQLEDVERGAELCVEAEVRILNREGKGYILRNGPFHRRFLDGYYPMHVTVEIEYPRSLEVTGGSPPEQPGFAVVQQPGYLELDAWFAGRLEIEVRFSKP